MSGCLEMICIWMRCEREREREREMERMLAECWLSVLKNKAIYLVVGSVLVGGENGGKQRDYISRGISKQRD